MRFSHTFHSIVVSILLLFLGGFGGYYLGVQGYEVNLKKNLVPVEIINKERADIPESVDFDKFWNVWQTVNAKHIRRPIDPNKLLDGAIHGMVDAIEDPYTAYLDLEQNQEARASLNGHYDGIGAQLGFDDSERLIIVAPLDGSPAKSAGLKAGDRITRIEGEDTSGISVPEAVNRIRGEAGTGISLTLAREGVEEPFDVRIIRDTIKLESVIWEDKGDGIAYVRLSRFGESTNSEWETAVNEITSQMPNLRAVILDVRDNPGGFLESSVYVASEFVSSGVIVSEDFSTGEKVDFRVDHKGKLTSRNLDVVVLINGGSASASEIVAGALKESAGAVLVGTRSFGKGSVQTAEEFRDGSGLHVTVAKWLTPDGNWIDKVNSEFRDSVYNEIDSEGNQIIGGIKPDHFVEITDEDIVNGNDLQLQKALEILN